MKWYSPAGFFGSAAAAETYSAASIEAFLRVVTPTEPLLLTLLTDSVLFLFFAAAPLDEAETLLSAR